jgi:hypothetical protein
MRLQMPSVSGPGHHWMEIISATRTLRTTLLLVAIIGNFVTITSMEDLTGVVVTGTAMMNHSHVRLRRRTPKINTN